MLPQINVLWKLRGVIAAGAALLVIAGMWFYMQLLQEQRDRALDAKGALLAQLQRAQADIATCRDASRAQNDAIEALRRAGDELAAKQSAARVIVKEVRTRTRRQVQHDLVAKVPSECEAAVQWGAEIGPTLVEGF